MRISLQRFEALAREESQRVLDSLPHDLLADAEEVILEVEEWPTSEQRESFADEEGHLGDLFGLYDGVPLVERSPNGFYPPDRITLFAGPHARACRTDVELRRQIRRTLVHELGHFFGMDEDELLNRGVG